MIEKCELLHGQFFYLIKFYEFYIRLHKLLSESDLIEKVGNLKNHEKSLIELKQLYRISEQKLDDSSFADDINSQMRWGSLLKQSIGRTLLEFDELQNLKWSNELSEWGNKKSTKFVVLLDQLLNLFKQIISADNQQLLDANYDLFMEPLSKLQHLLLRLVLSADYSFLLRIEEESFLLDKWQKELIQFKQSVEKNSLATYSRAIKVEEKLLAGKNQFQHFFYAEAAQRRALIEDVLLQSLDTKQEKKISEYLRFKNDELKNAVAVLESSLKTEYYDAIFLAKLATFWRRTHYYGYAAAIYSIAEESTTAHFVQQIPIMREQLWPETMAFFTHTCAVLVLALDIYLAQYLGVSYTLVSSVADFLMLEVANQQDFFDSIGEHRKAMYTEVLPLLKQVLNLGVYLLMQCLVTGFSRENMLLALGAYCIGMLFQQAVSYLLGKVANFYSLGVPAHQLLNLLHGYISFSLGVQFGYALTRAINQKINANLDEVGKQIIFNDAMCQKQQPLCCEQAGAILAQHGLETHPRSSKFELKAKLRHFLLGHHPDKTFDVNKHVMYHEVSAARQIFNSKCKK